MLEGPFCTFWNPYKETLVSGLGVWNPYRKPRSQVWEGLLSKGLIFRFRNPYKKHWSQVWESGIPVENLGLWSGRVALKGSDFPILETL